MSHTAARTLALLSLSFLSPRVPAQPHFLTTTIEAAVAGDALRFDFSALPPATSVLRAVLRVSSEGHETGVGVRVVPLGEEDSGPLTLRPPRYDSFDATAAVRSWLEDPNRQRGVRVAEDAGVDFRGARLEVSYHGIADKPIPPVRGLRALHQSGQTFLTWMEIEDPVGADRPAFADFERAVLQARERRRMVYRVYRHSEPIRIANLGQAELVREIPEVLSAWNLKAIRNTEHPNQGTPTKRSVLRPGYNLALNHRMERYRVAAGAPPLPRATGLAVFTVTEPGPRFYAVAPAVDGGEAIAELACLARPVLEKPAPFPAVVYQRTVSAERGQHGCDVDVYNSWLEPPYTNLPGSSETFVVRWHDLPRDRGEQRWPLMVTTGTHGGSATELANPGWHAARRHVSGALTVGITEGGLWQGFHECIGTLRGYASGVVHNYPQRRVLSVAAWALAEPTFSLDPDRVSIWGQMAAWALRHGDLFSVVMSNGYGNLAIGKEAQKHGWKWGPYPEGSENWLGIDQWEYMNLAKWIHENPSVELPYWLCWPAYGAYPSHTVGDFGFMPWPEMIHAMVSTKRAFAANWSTNGPGPLGPLRDLVPRLRRNQSLPAFTRCSLDASPGDGDHADAEKGGGINLYQLWEPETVLDGPNRWEVTLYLRDDCPHPSATTNLTPRRCRRFRAQPGEKFRWTVNVVEGEGEAGGSAAVQSGAAVADENGLVTIEALRLSRGKRRVRLERDN